MIVRRLVDPGSIPAIEASPAEGVPGSDATGNAADVEGPGYPVGPSGEGEDG